MKTVVFGPKTPLPLSLDHYVSHEDRKTIVDWKAFSELERLTDLLGDNKRQARRILVSSGVKNGLADRLLKLDMNKLCAQLLKYKVFSQNPNNNYKIVSSGAKRNMNPRGIYFTSPLDAKDYGIARYGRSQDLTVVRISVGSSQRPKSR